MRPPPDHLILDMSEQAVNLLLQIPLAGVVVVVVIVFLRHLEKSSDQMVKFLDAQAATNREFLTAQREQFAAAMARLAEEMKLVRLEMAEMKGRIKATHPRGSQED